MRILLTITFSITVCLSSHAQQTIYQAVYHYQTPYNLNKKLDSLQAKVSPNTSFKFFQSQNHQDSIVSSNKKDDSLLINIGRLQSKIAITKLVFKAYCTPSYCQYFILSDTGFQLSKNTYHRNFDKTVMENNTVFVIIDNEKCIKSVINTMNTDAPPFCWNIDTAQFHFKATKHTKHIGEWNCIEYLLTSPGNENVSVWVCKDLPAYIHSSEIMGIGLPGAIVELEFKNKCSLTLTDLSKTEDVIIPTTTCDTQQDRKTINLLDIPMRNW